MRVCNCSTTRCIAAEGCQHPSQLPQPHYRNESYNSRKNEQRAEKNVATRVKLVTFSQSSTLLHTWVQPYLAHRRHTPATEKSTQLWQNNPHISSSHVKILNTKRWIAVILSIQFLFSTPHFFFSIYLQLKPEDSSFLCLPNYFWWYIPQAKKLGGWGLAAVCKQIKYESWYKFMSSKGRGFMFIVKPSVAWLWEDPTETNVCLLFQMIVISILVSSLLRKMKENVCLPLL